MECLFEVQRSSTQTFSLGFYFVRHSSVQSSLFKKQCFTQLWRPQEATASLVLTATLLGRPRCSISWARVQDWARGRMGPA